MKGVQKKVDQRIKRNLNLHAAIQRELERQGMNPESASQEALRRMKDKDFRFNHFEDYFTAVEREVYSLRHG